MLSSKSEALELAGKSPIPTAPAVEPNIEQPTANKLSQKIKQGSVETITTGRFEAEHHFYPRVLNANIHPLVASFFSLGNDRILARYSHLNPSMDVQTLKNLLSYEPQYFRWAGNSLLKVCVFGFQNFQMTYK
jgi:hypothetical protein